MVFGENGHRDSDLHLSATHPVGVAGEQLRERGCRDLKSKTKKVTFETMVVFMEGLSGMCGCREGGAGKARALRTLQILGAA